ncbi:MULTISPECIES: hypothetical protein [Nostocales]|uniref:Uncharacterized protein n=1 Tax=Dolichospermum flos-aquae UHCC 0037 TaxID=2590026 RepID=A0ACC7SCG0_DOLFA|nr:MULTISPECIES: hypothetical protein [Nostocales]MBO1063731.1 hypothetical protein [Anabaena sp. 54]MTJ46222.1 hypothetical protein [Dolichospermum flos-aquae UHCC 0037]QSV72702.1 MAG: hypothetical protein HEQ20_20585 [Aphanizomenon flos-aquae KM1D3_PB]
MHPQQIKEQLKLLIEEASTIDPSLAIRLNQINNWIKDVKPGTLMSKRFVLLFLQQFIRDTEIRLDIKRLTSEAERQDVYELMTPPERYWYGELFPRWLSKNDPKFHIWRKKLMSGEFNQEDEKLINLIADVIKRNGGQALQRYIIDLSMASDIIVSSIQEQPLCIQLTSQSQEFTQAKSDDWENTLISWGIARGLFLSFNPGESDFINQIVNLALDKSNNLNNGIYQKINL